MADETDPLTQAMIDAGLYPQQLRQIQQQYQMGQQFMEPQQARGAQVGNTYVASSPLEHLSNAIRQVVGAKMAGSAMQREQDLTKQVGAGRQRFAEALQGTGGKTVAGDYGEPLPGVGADPQAAQRLMMMGSLSADPGMQHAAQMYMEQQNQARQMAVLQNTQRYQQGMLGLKGAEQGMTTDAEGNPVRYMKHALPGAVSGAGGGGGGAQAPKTGFDPAAIDKFAEQFAVTGQMPQVGAGKRKNAIQKQIANRAFELFPDVNLAENKAGYVADTGSLRKLTQQNDAMNSFENTALKNAKLFLDAAHKVVDTGSPLFNAPARKFEQMVSGNPNMTEFNVTRQVAAQEISKVLGGSLGGSAVSDSARQEALGLLNKDASIAQIERAVTVLEKDMANRHSSNDEQISAIRSRAGGKKGGGQGGAPAAAAPPMKRKVYDPATGTIKEAP